MVRGVFLSQKLGMRVNRKLIMIMELVVNFASEEISLGINTEKS
jgi:hypothetical protein